MSEYKSNTEAWPSLPWDDWKDTCATLHMWMQIIGKIRLKLSPPVNHWWHVTFYVTASGMTTSPIPYGTRSFEIIFDFIESEVRMETCEGKKISIALRSQTVADFYNKISGALKTLNIEVSIWTTPVEVAERIPFEKDQTHFIYDPAYVLKWWQVLVQTDRIMKKFRSNFIGKVSPVHFFWGSLDLAVTRFSSSTAPQHPGSPNVGRAVMIEAYSHEVSSCGFWPGAGIGFPAFYSYTYPEPNGFESYPIKPAEAYYDKQLKLFLLPYDVIRSASSPDDMLLAFFQSTYEAGANLGKWNRDVLERQFQ